MPGVSAPTACLSASRVFASFTLVASVFNAAVVASAPSSALYDFTVLPRSVTADWHASRAIDTRWFSYALYPHTPPATSATAATAATPMTTGLRFFLPAGTVPSTGVDCGMVSGVMLSFSSMTTPSRLRCDSYYPHNPLLISPREEATGSCHASERADTSRGRDSGFGPAGGSLPRRMPCRSIRPVHA